MLYQMLKEMEGGKITCEEAHGLASNYGLSPGELGELLDKHSIKIVACQLGLFGYGQKKKDIPSIEEVEYGLTNEVRSMAQGGRLGCKEAWAIADGRGLQRKLVSGICEKLGIKISACQLGAF